MKLWLFIFTQPDRKFVSARVAADTRDEACSIMGEALQRILVAQENVHPEPGTILTMIGNEPADHAGLVHLRDLNNELWVPA